MTEFTTAAPSVDCFGNSPLVSTSSMFPVKNNFCQMSPTAPSNSLNSMSSFSGTYYNHGDVNTSASTQSPTSSSHSTSYSFSSPQMSSSSSAGLNITMNNPTDPNTMRIGALSSSVAYSASSQLSSSENTNHGFLPHSTPTNLSSVFSHSSGSSSNFSSNFPIPPPSTFPYSFSPSNFSSNPVSSPLNFSDTNNQSNNKNGAMTKLMNMNNQNQFSSRGFSSSSSLVSSSSSSTVYSSSTTSSANINSTSSFSMTKSFASGNLDVQTRNLYIHNVPRDATEEDLRNFFKNCGVIERVQLRVNQKIGPHAVYAFVLFKNAQEAKYCHDIMNGSVMKGRQIRVEYQRQNKHEEERDLRRVNRVRSGRNETGVVGANGRDNRSSTPGISTEYNNDEFDRDQYANGRNNRRVRNLPSETGGNVSSKKARGLPDSEPSASIVNTFTGNRFDEDKAEFSNNISTPYGIECGNSKVESSSNYNPQAIHSSLPYGSANDRMVQPLSVVHDAASPPRIKIHLFTSIKKLLPNVYKDYMVCYKSNTSTHNFNPRNLVVGNNNTNDGGNVPKNSLIIGQSVSTSSATDNLYGSNNESISHSSATSSAKSITSSSMSSSSISSILGSFSNTSVSYGSLVNSARNVCGNVPSRQINENQANFPNNAGNNYQYTNQKMFVNPTLFSQPSNSSVGSSFSCDNSSNIALNDNNDFSGANIYQTNPNFDQFSSNSQKFQVSTTSVMSNNNFNNTNTENINNFRGGIINSNNIMNDQSGNNMSNNDGIAGRLPLGQNRGIMSDKRNNVCGRFGAQFDMTQQQQYHTLQNKGVGLSVPNNIEFMQNSNLNFSNNSNNNLESNTSLNQPPFMNQNALSNKNSIPQQIWKGTMARNEKKRVEIKIFALAGNVFQYITENLRVVNVSHRSKWEEIAAKTVLASCYLQVSKPEQTRHFNDYIDYFISKDRAGVASLDNNYYLYILPPRVPLFERYKTANITSNDVMIGLIGSTQSQMFNNYEGAGQPQGMIQSNIVNNPNENTFYNKVSSTAETSSNTTSKPLNSTVPWTGTSNANITNWMAQLSQMASFLSSKTNKNESNFFQNSLNMGPK